MMWGTPILGNPHMKWISPILAVPLVHLAGQNNLLLKKKVKAPFLSNQD